MVLGLSLRAPYWPSAPFMATIVPSIIPLPSPFPPRYWDPFYYRRRRFVEKEEMNFFESVRV